MKAERPDAQWQHVPWCSVHVLTYSASMCCGAVCMYWRTVTACAVVQCTCTGLVHNPTLLNHGSRYIYRCTCRYWGSICLAHVFSASLLVCMVTHGTEKIYSRGDKNTNSHLSHCQLGHWGMFTPWSMTLLSDLNWRRWAGVRQLWPGGQECTDYFTPEGLTWQILTLPNSVHTSKCWFEFLRTSVNQLR